MTDNKQPEITVGLIGHVDHGKTTLLEKLSGKWTDIHSEEIKKGITIKLGYADISIYKCDKCGFTTKPCDKCKKERTISFVDAPGHETLMATMLSGAAIMDGALLLVAANEQCPQPQTKEHLIALQTIGIKNIIIIQNKIDIVSKEDAIKNYKQIKEFTKGTIAENAPIIPVSAINNINIDKILEAIQINIPTPKRDLNKSPLMLIARSFDVNKPGTKIQNLIGGILGGSIKQGILHTKDPIVILPGRKVEEHGQTKWIPIESNIIDIKTGNKSVSEIQPGGSMSLLTKLDPSIVKSDQLVGNIVGLKDKMPPVWNTIKIQPSLLDTVVGSKEEIKVEPIKKGEPLMLNANSATTAGIVTTLEKNTITIVLKRPICTEENSKIAISRRVGTRWRLIGSGILKK